MIGIILMCLGFAGIVFEGCLGEILPDEVDYWMHKVSGPLVGIGLLLAILGL